MKNIKNELNQFKPLFDYFLIIGVDPRVSLNNYLYYTSIEELNTFFIKDEIYPKILSKFPPLKKSYIDIHSSIIDLCFQNEFYLEEHDIKPEPSILHFLLDNSFYSLDYLLKYVTCLKFYENLEQYFLLKNEIHNLLGNEYHNSWKIFGTSKKGKKYKSVNDLDKYNRNKSEYEINDNNNILGNNKNLKKYYFPKIICLVSTQPFYKEQEKILKQIYNYYIDKTPKKIPLEKIILNILLNIPIPPKGLLEFEYNLNEKNEKIIIKKEKMNQLFCINDQLKIIFDKFSINKILIIFFNILFENKIIFFSSNVNYISYFIYGLISLLFPFYYSFQISSSIPKEAFDILESISPFILGINHIFSNFFFTKKKFDTNDLNLLIIDLDSSKIKRIGKDNLPVIPKNLYNILYDELNKILSVEKNKIDYSKIREAFFNFMINILYDYELYLNKENFLKNLANTGIKGLFKINKYILAHNNYKDFYQRLIETQMFCDFIIKKLIPKNKKEILEILFFDENIIKKFNKKISSKDIILLNSKKYEYKNKYIIPKIKNLTKNEKKILFNDEEINKLILYGQKIIIEKQENSEENNILFDYIIFPMLNKNFFENIAINEYFILPNEYSYFDKINNDIVIKASNKYNKKNTNNSFGQEILNNIYLTFVELWSSFYWYFESSEKNIKFIFLLKILDIISYHEIEIFESLFNTFLKFHEINKIKILYEKLLEYKINPSSYIFSLVNNNLKREKSLKLNEISLNNTIYSKSIYHLKRTFRSNKELNLLGDKVFFYTKQPCSECYKEIDILELCKNYKNIKKEIFWAECPFCKKEILPKLIVSLGSELFIKNNNDFNTSKKTQFTLLSTNEIKNNIKDIINKNKDKIFHILNFKDDYTNLFWSCIWYFKLNKIDLDIILPYEWNIIQESNTKIPLRNNIISLISKKINDKEDIKTLNKNYLKKRKNKNNNKNKIFIIHNVHSFYYNPKEENKNKINNIKQLNIQKKDFIKRKTMNYESDYFLSRIRLDNYSEEENMIYSSHKQNKKNVNNKENNYFINVEDVIVENK